MLGSERWAGGVQRGSTVPAAAHTDETGDTESNELNCVKSTQMTDTSLWVQLSDYESYITVQILVI